MIAKHAQLLSDAGVDLVVFDVTNSLIYLPQALRVCSVWDRLKHLGWDVPRVAFLTNTAHERTTERLYDGFYAKNYYPDLWFRWKGKPLLMGNPEGLSDEIQDFFTIRRSWAWTDGQEWFGDGKDKWAVARPYPPELRLARRSGDARADCRGHRRAPGFETSAAASTTDGSPRRTASIRGRGCSSPSSGGRALEVDPEFVFVTGWNEWAAMRFTDGNAKQIMGRPVEKGDTYFVDQFNAEFSRDIEPMKGGFGDKLLLPAGRERAPLQGGGSTNRRYRNLHHRR